MLWSVTIMMGGVSLLLAVANSQFDEPYHSMYTKPALGLFKACLKIEEDYFMTKCNVMVAKQPLIGELNGSCYPTCPYRNVRLSFVHWGKYLNGS